jgi:tape measure domain-containing protein
VITVGAAINSDGARRGAAQFDAATASIRHAVGTTKPHLDRLNKDVAHIGETAQISARQTATAAQSIGQHLRGIGVALATVSAAAFARQIVSAADALATLRARIETTTELGADRVLEKVGAAAERSKAPLSAFADVYLKIGAAFKEMGRSQGEAIRFTETLAKSAALAGISADKLGEEMLQLVQALQSGKFQGDEFRSVAERMPDVLRILQVQTGSTRAELMKLAEDGRLSARVLANSLLNASDDIDRKFAKLPTTAGRSFDLMVDKFQQLTAEAGKNAGVSEAWAKVWNSVTDAMSGPKGKAALEDTARSLVSVADGALLVGKAMAQAAEGIKNLYNTIGDSGPLKGFADYYSQLKTYGADGYADVTKRIGDKGRARTAVSALDLSAVAQQSQEMRGRAFRGDIDMSSGSALGSLRNPYPQAPESAAANPERAGLTAQHDAIRTQASALVKSIELAQQLTSETAAIAGAAGWKTETIGPGGWRTSTSGELDAPGGKYDAKPGYDEDTTKRLKQELALADIVKERTAAEAAGDDMRVKALENQLVMQKLMTEENQKGDPIILQRLVSTNLETKALEEQLRSRAELNRVGEDGARILFNGLMEGAKAGKSFKDSIKNVVAQLAEMIFKLTVIEPMTKSIGKGFGNAAGGGGGFSLGNLFGGGGGGASDPASWATTVTPEVQFANGDVFDRPMKMSAPGFRGVMAEAGPEAVMPLSRGADGRLGVKAGMPDLKGFGGMFGPILQSLVGRLKSQTDGAAPTGLFSAAASLAKRMGEQQSQAAGVGHVGTPAALSSATSVREAAGSVVINISGDATAETVERLRRVAQEEFARGAPGLINGAVSRVADERRRNPRYLR